MAAKAGVAMTGPLMLVFFTVMMFNRGADVHEDAIECDGRMT